MTSNTNKYLLATCALVVSVGAQSVVKDTGKFLSEVVIPHPVSKVIIIFCMFFMTTRDVAIASMCSTVYVVFVLGMFDERHSYSIVADKKDRALP